MLVVGVPCGSLRVYIDFTGPMGANTGGATYVDYLLPRWLDHPDDEVVAAFSYGHVPPAVAGRGGVIELPRRTARGGIDRVLDMHSGTFRLARAYKPDVAYFPGNFIPIGGASRTPKVVAVRSLLPHLYPSQVSWPRGLLQRAALRQSVLRADRIIVPSAWTGDRLMRLLGARRRQMVVIPHGVDLDRFGPPQQVRTGGRFLFVSRPADYKGLDTVFRALRELCRHRQSADASLVVADGGIRARDKEAWLRLAERLGIHGRVEFKGRVSHDELPAIYGSAAALVVPSSCESFGNIYLEAAASGCLVIAPLEHGSVESVGPVAIPVPAQSHLGLADAMRQVLDLDADARAREGARLRSWAERFPWDLTFARTREVLEELT
jgi:glycosyltransferase involved in cell wall biosynthesis